MAALAAGALPVAASADLPPAPVPTPTPLATPALPVAVPPPISGAAPAVAPAPALPLRLPLVPSIAAAPEAAARPDGAAPDAAVTAGPAAPNAPQAAAPATGDPVFVTAGGGAADVSSRADVSSSVDVSSRAVAASAPPPVCPLVTLTPAPGCPAAPPEVAQLLGHTGLPLTGLLGGLALVLAGIALRERRRTAGNPAAVKAVDYSAVSRTRGLSASRLTLG